MDAFVNNIGVVLSAVLTLVLVAIVARKTPELAKHLNAVSSYRVGPGWRIMVTIVTPIILTIILITGAIGYITNGYGTFPGWFVGLVGWGTLGLLLVFSFAMSYRGYARTDIHGELEDSDTLAIEVQREKERMRQARARGKVSS